jgi:hypothetical protein
LRKKEKKNKINIERGNRMKKSEKNRKIIIIFIHIGLGITRGGNSSASENMKTSNLFSIDDIPRNQSQFDAFKISLQNWIVEWSWKLTHFLCFF